MQQQAAAGDPGDREGGSWAFRQPRIHLHLQQLQQQAASQPALAERRQTLPIWFVLDGFLGVGLHFFFKEVFIFWQFSICFIYRQNLCWRSLTPTDLLVFFARGRINPESGDWWDFLFPYLPLIQRAHSPCSLTSLQALFAKCCSLW